MKRVWLLNLGAELELEGREQSKAARAMCKVAARKLAETLVPGGDDWFVDAMSKTLREHGFAEGRAFLPTPHARLTLQNAGAVIEAPSAEILRAANSRSFSAAHFPRQDVYVLHAEDDLRCGGARLLKRDLSFAGGGQRRISDELDDADRTWLRASLVRGPVCVEPWRDIEEEVGLPGYVHHDGRIEVGRVVDQVVVHGQWRESRVGTRELPALGDECHEAGRHLAELGYFGPFNIDAYRSRDAGWTHVSEINARYTMGWALGWASSARPDLPE